MQAAVKNKERKTSTVQEVVELNVGGKLYTTSLQTLLKDPESLLAKYFDGTEKIPKDANGKCFIDRDGILFSYVLEFLRNGKLTLSDSFSETERLLVEAEHFQLKGLVQAIRKLSHNDRILFPTKQLKGYLTLLVRGSFTFGRAGIADIKFRKLQRILVCGHVTLAREVFGDSLNESRDPDRHEQKYTTRFYLKHNSLEKAFDTLHASNFHMVTSAAGGAGYESSSEETNWNPVFNQRKQFIPPVAL